MGIGLLWKALPELLVILPEKIAGALCSGLPKGAGA